MNRCLVARGEACVGAFCLTSTETYPSVVARLEAESCVFICERTSHMWRLRSKLFGSEPIFAPLMSQKIRDNEYT